MSSQPRPNLKNPLHLLAFGLGSGLSPKAPGTMGTLAAIPVWWLLLKDAPDWAYACVLISAFAFGVMICQKTSDDLGVHDHGGIVWDEWVGLWLTYWALPSGWLWVAYGFVCFRVLDIAKPWPISWCDRRIHGGFGIMIDDVLAGLGALALVQLTWLALTSIHL